MKNRIKNLAIKLSNITKFKDNKVSFIYYHQVSEGNGNSYQIIEKEKFEEQMEWIKENDYTTILFKDLDKNISNNKVVCIIFDDGYRDNYELVFPLMKKLNLKFNIFLETGAIDINDSYLNWNMIREMKKSELVDFGLHTHTHIDARFIDKGNFNVEITYPNELFEAELLATPNDFCFPFGAYDKGTINYFLENTSYKNIYTSDGNRIKRTGEKNIIGRVGIENNDSIESFKQKVTGGYDNFYYFNYLLKRMFKRSEKNEYKKY